MAQSVALLSHNSFPLADAFKLTSDIQQYDKVLKLRDDIVAGTHPRIKLNGFVSASGSSDQVVRSNGTQINGTARYNSTSQNGLPGLQSSIPISHDPDSTLRSKARLERQRIERDISESLRKEKDVTGQRTYEQDILPDFDVTEVFFQAQENVKPLTQQLNRQDSNSVSGDEETFYSSGAGTEASEDQNAKKAATKPCKFFFEDGTCKKGDRCNFSHDQAFKQQLQKNATPARQTPPRHGFTAQGGRIRESPTYGDAEDGEVADEAPYSPSVHIAVEDLPLSQNNSQVSHFQAAFNYTPPNSARTDSRPQAKYPQRGKDTQVVRNHITSPIAPQPSRVSPLAVAKVSHINRRRNDNHRTSNQHQDTNSHQGPRSKKRRRDADTNDNARNVAQRTTMASPEPYIKPEPISPPPLSMVPQHIRRQSGFIENSSRYNDRSHESFTDSGSGRVSPRVVPTPPGHRRVLSGPGPAPEARRQQDLRRIVSTRNFERPPSPGNEVRSRPRTLSQFIVPREEVQPASYRASVQPQRQVYLVDDRPLSPTVRYSRRADEPDLIPIPPPAGRVVVDEYGNRYLETTMSNQRGTTIPEPRYVDEIRRRPENTEISRASVRPEPRYYEDRTYQSLQRASVRPEPQYLNERPRQTEMPPQRASVRPEPQYFEDRPRQNEAVSRASVRPEVQYYQERIPQKELTVLPRASVRPEARGDAIFINPSFEQVNLSGRTREALRHSNVVPEYLPRGRSPKPQPQSRILDSRASIQPTSRFTHEREATYQIQQEQPQQIDSRSVVRRAEDYGRMPENSSWMSVVPTEQNSRRSVRLMDYDEGAYRQSVASERNRNQESGRAPTGYTVAHQDAYGRQEFIDPPPATTAAYRYVSTARELPSGARQYDGHVYVG